MALFVGLRWRTWKIVSTAGTIQSKLHLRSASLESYADLQEVVQRCRPDEFKHFADQSFVSYSFEDEFSTIQSNATGTHFILATVMTHAPRCGFYFAGSSEMFGNAKEAPQNERTHFHPRSSHGIAKWPDFV